MRITPRADVARHEAGHVVAYLAHGLSFRYVTLRPRGSDALGLVKLDRPRVVDARILSEIALAGTVAELMVEDGFLDDPHVVAGDLVGGLFDHSADVRRYLAPFTNPIAEEEAVARRVAVLMDRSWDSVTAIAKAIDDSPSALSYRQVLATIGASTPEQAATIVNGASA